MWTRNQLYLQILKYGLVSIRASAHDGYARLCEIEADHLHNIPTLIDEENEQRHEYYFDKERTLYLERLQNWEATGNPLRGVHRFALQRFEELWAQLKNTRCI